MNVNLKIYNLLLIICLLSVGMLFYKKFDSFYRFEGFRQNEKFVLEKDENIYDDFYSEIYDQLHFPHKRIPTEVDAILQNTQCTPETSSFLDIGSGTGEVLIEFENRGFQIIGVENSKSMIQTSLNKHNQLSVENANIKNPMAFDKSIFTHILCLYYTIYHFYDKKIIFNNCYKWLKPGGFLILHLVDKDKFNKTIPIKKYSLNNSFFNFEDKKDDKVDFGTFEYKLSYEEEHTNKTIVTETFTDKTSNNIRQNELTFYMENIDVIVKIATSCGFIPHGVFNLKKIGDRYQYLYFFERSL
jgi:SAM-dependent methyltransferase